MFHPSHRTELRVSAYSLVNFETNRYSVPVSNVGNTVTLKAYPETVEIWSKGKMIAKHTRCYQREQSIYDLEHYLPILEKKGRTIFQAKPFIQNAPEMFVEWLKKKKEANDLNLKELVDLIRKGAEIGFDAVMSGDICMAEKASVYSTIHDTVSVSPPNLSEYDTLLGKEVIS